MHLLDGVALVGGGPVGGFGLTSGPDAHTYLIDGGDALALVDVGSGVASAFDELVANIRAAGHEPDAVGDVFLTHFHGDHAGGAARYARQFGARVHIAPTALDALASGDEEATGVAAGRDAGIYPEDYRLEAVADAQALDDGDSRACGQARVTAVAAPGHCTGHTAYLVEVGGRRCLFSGDALFWGGRILLQAVPDCDLQASLASIRRLAALEHDALLPGHGPVTLQQAGVHTQMALDRIDGLGVPANLI